MLPHAYVIALLHQGECNYFGTFVNVVSFLRVTCWNCTLAIFLIMGHSLLAWHPKYGMSLSD